MIHHDSVVPLFQSAFGSLPAFRLGRHALVFWLCLIPAMPSVHAQEEQQPPPDPLAPPAEPALNAGGYFGGGSVPASLKPPSRLRIGDFSLGGEASMGMLYDDNVEANKSERDEDIFLSFSPSIRAQSIYARHSIGFGASGSTGTALKDTTDDFFDWQIGADGRLDLSRHRKVNASVGYSRDVEDDEEIDSEDDDDDTPIHNINASVGYDVSGERLGFGVGSTVSRLDIEGDDFQDRDRTSYGLNGRVRYNWSKDLTLSAGPSYSHSTFDEDVADDGDSRDADEFGIVAGAGYRVSPAISTRASIGYSMITFDDPNRDDTGSFVSGAGLGWSLGRGTTLNLQASRSFGLSIEDGEDSRVSTSGSATVTHRLILGSRSVLTSTFGASVTHVSDLDRTDRNYVTGLTYAYRLAESASLSTSYRFSRRDSDEEDADFYRNLVSVGLTVSY